MAKGEEDEAAMMKIGGGDTCQGDSGGPLIRLASHKVGLIKVAGFS